MTCSETRELLSALLDQALDARERQQVEAHLADCPDCRRELKGLRSTVSLLSRLEHVRAPVGFVDKVMGEVYPPPWYRRLGRVVFLPLSVKLPLEAGAMALIAILGVYLLQSTPEMKDTARPDAPAVASRPDAPPEAPPAALPQASPRPPSRKGDARIESRGSPTSDGQRERPHDAPPTDLKKEAAPKAAPPAAEPEKPEAPAARSAAPKALYSREGSADRAEKDKKSAPSSAPAAPSEMSANRQAAAPMVSGVLTVKDRPQAERALADAITRTGARETGRRQEGNATIVDVVVPQAAYADFTRELGELGSVRLEGQPEATAALVRLSVRISE